jgi:hypothetical protein
MIPVKEAVKKAIDFLADTLEGEKLEAPRLEEIELSDDNAYWYVTVSFFRNDPRAALASALGGSSEGRDYKTITVDANNGAVKKMVIRQLT